MLTTNDIPSVCNLNVTSEYFRLIEWYFFIKFRKKKKKMITYIIC